MMFVTFPCDARNLKFVLKCLQKIAEDSKLYEFSISKFFTCYMSKNLQFVIYPKAVAPSRHD